MNILYGHGFASGPRSTKGLAFEAHFAAIGVAIDRLDLRVPSLEHLRLSAMIDTVRAAITDQAIVIGSSLGGLTAARAAERDPRIVAVVLMAPAFQLIARWRQRPDWEAWQRTGWLAIHDFADNKSARVDIGFADDATAVDVGYPDVRVPTLIFHGTNDDTVSIDRSRDFVAGNRHARLVELDDGHDLIASIPAILEDTERFLRPWLE